MKVEQRRLPTRSRIGLQRYGEAVVAVPITASAWRMARQVFGAMNELERGQSGGKVGYDLSGKFSSAAGLGSLRFSSRGELELPGMEQGNVVEPDDVLAFNAAGETRVSASHR
ncbi:MAG: hypothetical protein R3E75_04050 [Steroidobacteraceae bacterium]